MAAAHESGDHAANAESGAVGETTLEQLGEDVTRLARSYLHMPPFPLFTEMLRVRNRTYRLLDNTRRPPQQRDLYLIAGQVCGLLASASFDIGYPGAAAQQARAARAYAEIISHDELRAWADGALATVAFWSGRPRESLICIERGLEFAPAGTPEVRLWCIGARAAAHLGDADHTRRAIAAAADARSRVDGATELHVQIGGEFGWSQCRQSFCSGSAYLRLASAADALRECSHAIAWYEAEPPQRRWYAAEHSARADLAAAHLLYGDLPGAEDALTPVFALAPDKRVDGLVQRLSNVRAMLMREPLRADRQAAELGEQIEGFTVDAIANALPLASAD